MFLVLVPNRIKVCITQDYSIEINWQKLWVLTHHVELKNLNYNKKTENYAWALNYQEEEMRESIHIREKKRENP